jgi:hypothetical protein
MSVAGADRIDAPSCGTTDRWCKLIGMVEAVGLIISPVRITIVTLSDQSSALRFARSKDEVAHRDFAS